SPFPQLPVQYADFAVWQRERLTPELDQHLEYWKRQLADLTLLQFPLDRPRPPVQTFAGSNYRFRVAGELAAGLRTLAQRNKATLFMTVLAAFAVLLHRYTGQTDIAIGSPVANRDRPEIQGLIGCFVNMLVLRVDASAEPRFEELLARVRKTAMEAYAHQDLP